MELRTTNTSIPEDPTLDNCSVDIESNGNNSGHENDEESVVEVTPTTSTKRASVNVKRCTRKSNFIEEKLVSFMEAHQPRQDLLIEDLSFFKSLLPTVRKLNADKKFTFRMQTMQILQNLQQGTSATIEARPNNFISFPPPNSLLLRMPTLIQIINLNLDRHQRLHIFQIFHQATILLMIHIREPNMTETIFNIQT